MPRKLPMLTAENRAFWQGGERGELLIYRCRSCEAWFHPPAPVCPRCNAVEVGPEPVSGRGTVATFTINIQAWTPELAEPYVVAIVELVEQPGLRFATNIVGCAPDQVAIDMPVRVTFLPCDDVWLPLFEKDA
ncbi:OB-fold domain-containing protein [Sphingomonas sp. A2-49]|uniref:Zn-ribbon domain-containing OB-fold protein n=1 Tax=Sphingomonas sp. A2-49 TaxID=1391375 RepID=UPI0021D3DF1B|nr:OB-fold domain-containing protein [Sphingomonas sp. A2-49]MCU6453128.1 OB-fold domain-containing protein [Sphingomonas sp. A2-49]